MLAPAPRAGAPRMADDVLIYSLREHRELIFECLAAATPKRVVEIGSEAGGMTREMVAWAEREGVRFVTVEPFPVAEIQELARGSDAFDLVQRRSPQALEDLGAADAYLVDGDHNHWTVSHELRAIYSTGAPLTILHDVGWPCARRDQYYSVESLPPEAVHPHSFTMGRVPGRAELVEEGGFGGAGGFAVALEEGGPRNGVLTAVEDFLAEHGGLEYAHVPAVFGLGIVYATSAPYAGRLRELLAPWHENPVLERIERNRVELYVRVLEQQDLLMRAGRGTNRVLLGYAQRLAELEAENASLRLERARLRETLDEARAGSDAPVA
jgi:methyltransferase family protein